MRRGCRPGGKFDGGLTFTDADGAERQIEVSLEVSPYDPGVYSGPMENSYPAEGGCVEGADFWLVSKDGKTAERKLDEGEVIALLAIDGKELCSRLQDMADAAVEAAGDDGPEPDDGPEYDDRFADGEFSDACDRYTR